MMTNDFVDNMADVGAGMFAGAVPAVARAAQWLCLLQTAQQLRAELRLPLPRSRRLLGCGE